VISSSHSPNLQPLHTFGLPAKANCIETFSDLESLRSHLKNTPSPHLILGDGSNVAFVGDFPGTVLLNRIKGLHLENTNSGNVKVIAGAGEDWHGLVRWTLENGLYGLENLSLIPGRVGAAPIQNIGAYGIEVADLFKGCQAFDRKTEEVIFLDHETCNFAYRDSIFKREKDRYVVLEVHLELSQTFQPNLDYGNLARKANELDGDLDGLGLSQIVSDIRRKKLPHPCDLGNAGSFFKNPIVDLKLKTQLEALTPSPPLYEMEDGSFKTSAAWLIDQCGLKGASEGPIAVHEAQPLVLVNHGGGNGQQLLSLAQRVQKTVRESFGITLEREVRLIPSSEGS